MKKLLTLAMVLSVLLVGMPAVAVADTHNVNPGEDIQAVIDDAGPGDTIVFAPGTYSLSATLNVNKSLTLTSAALWARSST
jgi:nitrous oxidase accessory protein NosD